MSRAHLGRMDYFILNNNDSNKWYETVSCSKEMSCRLQNLYKWNRLIKRECGAVLLLGSTLGGRPQNEAPHTYNHSQMRMALDAIYQNNGCARPMWLWPIIFFMMLTDDDRKLGWKVCSEWMIKVSFYGEENNENYCDICVSHFEWVCDASHLPRKTNWICIRVKVILSQLALHSRQKMEIRKNKLSFSELNVRILLFIWIRTKRKLQFTTPNASCINTRWLYMAQQTKSNLNKKISNFQIWWQIIIIECIIIVIEIALSKRIHTHTRAENRHVIWWEWIVFPSMSNDAWCHSSRCMELCIESKAPTMREDLLHRSVCVCVWVSRQSPIILCVRIFHLFW